METYFNAFPVEIYPESPSAEPRTCFWLTGVQVSCEDIMMDENLTSSRMSFLVSSSLTWN